ncbi:UPF0524 protein C3orf70 B [Merluccius polli]|uniref:UPF0524 protein C3orf70 B n=1 Tax=Merluccius polli TaxID=89951 RepID=A0AA47N545_MERPO|nr:UPF0524 protein C3orf70 B [Merluccius polli]
MAAPGGRPGERGRERRSAKVDEAQASARSCAGRPDFLPRDGAQSASATHSHGKCFRLHWCCLLGWCHCKYVYQPMTNVLQLPSTPVPCGPGDHASSLSLSALLAERFLRTASCLASPTSEPGVGAAAAGPSAEDYAVTRINGRAFYAPLARRPKTSRSSRPPANTAENAKPQNKAEHRHGLRACARSVLANQNAPLQGVTQPSPPPQVSDQRSVGQKPASGPEDSGIPGADRTCEDLELNEEPDEQLGKVLNEELDEGPQDLPPLPVSRSPQEEEEETDGLESTSCGAVRCGAKFLESHHSSTTGGGESFNLKSSLWKTLPVPWGAGCISPAFSLPWQCTPQVVPGLSLLGVQRGLHKHLEDTIPQNAVLRRSAPAPLIRGDSAPASLIGRALEAAPLLRPLGGDAAPAIFRLEALAVVEVAAAMHAKLHKNTSHVRRRDSVASSDLKTTICSGASWRLLYCSMQMLQLSCRGTSPRDTLARSRGNHNTCRRDSYHGYNNNHNLEETVTTVTTTTKTPGGEAVTAVLRVPVAQGDDVIQRALQAVQWWRGAVLGRASFSFSPAPFPSDGLQDSLQLLIRQRGQDHMGLHGLIGRRLTVTILLRHLETHRPTDGIETDRQIHRWDGDRQTDRQRTDTGSVHREREIGWDENFHKVPLPQYNGVELGGLQEGLEAGGIEATQQAHLLLVERRVKGHCAVGWSALSGETDRQTGGQRDRRRERQEERTERQQE